jgi:hypothetical protein
MPAARGRPTVWENRNVELAYGQALLGKTNPQIAEALGVGTATLKRWMASRPDFRAAIVKGKAEADGHVVASLYMCALGYFKDVELVKVLSNGRIVRTTIKKFFPADPRAAEVWLRNRVRELWANADAKPDTDPLDQARELRRHLDAMDKADGFELLAELVERPDAEAPRE